MTIRKLLLTLSIVLSCGLVVSGIIVSAQEAPKAPEAPKSQKAPKAPKDELAENDFDFDFKLNDKFDFNFDDFDFKFDDKFAWQDGDRNFTLFLQGGTFLGVHVEDVTKENMSRYGMRDVRGVGVTEIVKDSPAEKAGLKPGDAILSFDGHTVDAEKDEDLNEFRRMVAQTPVGRGASMEILRGGKMIKLQTIIGLQPEMDPDEVDTDLDFKVKEITPHMVRDYMLLQRTGVIVSFVQPGGYVASEAGLLPGDVLLEFGGEPVRDIAGFKVILKKVADKPEILVRVQRGLDQNFLVLKPGQVGKSDKEEDKQ